MPSTNVEQPRQTMATASPRRYHKSWADADWFHLQAGRLRKKVSRLTVFKVPPPGETNTDDLSLGALNWAWSPPRNIPLHCQRHARKTKREGIEPVEQGKTGPLKQIEAVQGQGLPCGLRPADVVGTGLFAQVSHQLRAVVLWPTICLMSQNKRAGPALCFGRQDSPILLQPIGKTSRRPLRSKWMSKSWHGRRDTTSIPYAGKVLQAWQRRRPSLTF